MLTNVAVLAYEGVAPFELGVLCEAFGLDRTAHGVPMLEFAVCAESSDPIPTSMAWSGCATPTWWRCPRCSAVKRCPDR